MSNRNDRPYKRTFLLPNFNDRVLQGKGTRGSVGSYLSESLPNITGGLFGNRADGVNYGFGEQSEGAFVVVNNGYTAYGGGAKKDRGKATFNASRCSSTYQDNAPVQQNALCVNMIIKY